MKILVGSIQQETNSFSPVVPTFHDFDFVADRDVLNKIAVTGLFSQAGAELFPTVYANAVPSGRMKSETFYQLCDELISRIPSGIRFDGVWLYCHGAMDVEDIGSGELELVRLIRDKIGSDVPIAMALDFHANINEQLLEYVNILCGYKTAPHRDMEETQILAGKLLLQCITEKLLPKPVMVRIPLLLSGDMVITEREPMRLVMSTAKDAVCDDEILEASVFNGQNWVDVPNGGASVVVTAKRDRELALKKAKEIAEKYWKLRHDFSFQIDAVEPETAVDISMAQAAGPVFISDSGDNTTAGAGGDNTELLKILIEKKAEKVIVGAIADKAAVNDFWDVPIGTWKIITLGGQLDRNSQKVTIECKLIHKGRILGWDGYDAGRAIVVKIAGIDIIITENRCSLISPEIFASVGIDIHAYKIVVVKLGYLYPKLEKVAKKSIIAFTNGASCVNLKKLDFKNLKRPMYPLDGDFVWKNI